MAGEREHEPEPERHRAQHHAHAQQAADLLFQPGEIRRVHQLGLTT